MLSAHGKIKSEQNIPDLNLGFQGANERSSGSSIANNIVVQTKQQVPSRNQDYQAGASYPPATQQLQNNMSQIGSRNQPQVSSLQNDNKN